MFTFLIVISFSLLIQFIKSPEVLPFVDPTTPSFKLQDLNYATSTWMFCTLSSSSDSKILLKYFKSGSDTFQAFPVSDGSTNFPDLPKVPFTRHLRHTTVPRPYGASYCKKVIPDRWYFALVYASKQPNGKCSVDVVYLDQAE